MEWNGLEWTKTRERGESEESSSCMSLSRVSCQNKLGNPKQHKQTAPTLHHKDSTAAKEWHEWGFSLGLVKRHKLCGILLQLLGFAIHSPECCWHPLHPGIMRRNSVGKTGQIREVRKLGTDVINRLNKKNAPQFCVIIFVVRSSGHRNGDV